MWQTACLSSNLPSFASSYQTLSVSSDQTDGWHKGFRKRGRLQVATLLNCLHVPFFWFLLPIKVWSDLTEQWWYVTGTDSMKKHDEWAFFFCLAKPIGSCDGIRAHLGKQWAAVRTHCVLTREPPQKCLPLRCRLACQGHAPAGAFVPPTILLFRGASPQTKGKQRNIM